MGHDEELERRFDEVDQEMAIRVPDPYWHGESIEAIKSYDMTELERVDQGL